MTMAIKYIGDIVQAFRNSSVLAMESLQFCSKLLIYSANEYA